MCARVGAALPDLLATAPTLVTVLAHARDPGNVGTVIRCSDAAGVGGVVLTDASVDPLNPKAVRASAGSLFHLPVVTGPSVEDLLPALRAAGLRVLAADGAGERDLDDLLDDLGIIHYASDTPYTRAQTLGARGMSYHGMDATYASTLAIVRRVFECCGNREAAP